ncbi:MAG: thymidylate kinase [Clostridia bacterium]|nr:thymidylate kinase [Clostridia bacterium]
MNKGKLIVIEGLDSSGKETQSRLLVEHLEIIGKKVKRIEFPNYKSDSSALVRMYLGGNFGNSPDCVNAYAASTFFAVDRYATYKTDFQQFLNEGGTIVADRYTTSNMIHQASKITDTDERNKYLEWLDNFEYTLLGLPRPDKVIFLDMPMDIAAKLMAARANKIDGSEKKDIHERNKEYLAATYSAALEVAEKFGWEHVMCGRNGEPLSIEEIHREVIKAAEV